MKIVLYIVITVSNHSITKWKQKLHGAAILSLLTQRLSVREESRYWYHESYTVYHTQNTVKPAYSVRYCCYVNKL